MKDEVSAIYLNTFPFVVPVERREKAAGLSPGRGARRDAAVNQKRKKVEVRVRRGSIMLDYL
jgi:hypothetical protein